MINENAPGAKFFLGIRDGVSYLVRTETNGWTGDERTFKSKAGADEEFNRMYELPARDHVWEKLQLWEINEKEGNKLLREERGK